MCYKIRRAEAAPVEEPGTVTQGAPLFPGSSRLGIESKTPGWLRHARTNHQPIGIYTGCYLYYFRTYYIAVRAGGKRIVEDM
jgi:hypothetical protein